MAKHSNMPYVEIDTVKSVREQGKRMLTTHFVDQNIMLIFLMRDGKGTTAVEQFDWLASILGLETLSTTLSEKALVVGLLMNWPQ